MISYGNPGRDISLFRKLVLVPPRPASYKTHATWLVISLLSHLLFLYHLLHFVFSTSSHLPSSMSVAEASAPHDEDWRYDGGSPSHAEDQDGGNLRQSEVANYVQARQRRRIAQLEQQLETLEAGRAAKEKYVLHYLH